ncbi:ABC Fe3+ siderophore transporter, periplasmic ligand binding protein [uncultured Sphingopyxis sp.]|uniref:ABC Fe3+ siderophore transporter, periplasmic ligand binding protein n=1 Tax=uncultured Sphingopyxis sp. TaxID=310581 RepID=A0A1Y5PQS5_9SPHN|nr:ABC transporter substrate-binding protein [uncultured Sphingopyxis sp.]SBV32368.1 ABC Fe3+ siderophore transporter, periplasmic ligand binding protein [uncultured Sphingopyxis sp.]
MATVLLAIAGPAFLISAASPLGNPPKGYPRSYRAIMDAARAERTLVIYSTTDRREAAGLLAAFEKRYPFVRVDYRELSTTTLHNRVIAEARRKQAGADLLWSAAMDLQTKLVNDGYAQAYASPEKPNLPPWAAWKNEAWGTTAEPVVFAYNRKLVPAADVPRTHADLTRLLRAKARFYRGRIATYDPTRSSAGYLFLSQDLQVSRDTVPLMAALGHVKVAAFPTSSQMLTRLGDGRLAFVYNMIGSYALERQSHDANIGVVMPSDYTLIMSRIAIIPEQARHPNAAKLFLDFMLSRIGQAQLAYRYMTPVRADVRARAGARAPASAARALRIGPALIANLDQMKRRRILSQWHAAIGTPRK